MAYEHTCFHCTDDVGAPFADMLFVGIMPYGRHNGSLPIGAKQLTSVSD